MILRLLDWLGMVIKGDVRFSGTGSWGCSFAQGYFSQGHFYLADQITLSLNLCDKPPNRLEARIFRRHFLQKCVNKSSQMAFGHLTACAGFGKNIFSS
jgi:hypothetical protein